MNGNKTTVTLKVVGEKPLALKTFELDGVGIYSFDKGMSIKDTKEFTVKHRKN